MDKKCFKNNIDIPKETILKYYDSLINDCFKILPISEGLDIKTKAIVYSEEDAFKQFKEYTSNFTFQVYGGWQLFDNNVNFLKLISILEGMQYIYIDEHDKLKSLVFNCINIIKKMKGEV